MKFLVLLIGEGEMTAWDDLTPEEEGAGMAKFQEFDAACAARDGVQILAGEALAPPTAATVLKTRSGKTTMTEGPYAEVLEGLGGFYLVEAPDLDVLTELLAILPPFDMQIAPAVDAA